MLLRSFPRKNFYSEQHTHVLFRPSCLSDVQTVTNLDSERAESSLQSPDLLTDQLDDNDSDLLSLLVPTRILFEGKAAYEGGRSEMEGRTGGER
jgi:hypothetical protein